jgi:hypothetical protein
MPVFISPILVVHRGGGEAMQSDEGRVDTGIESGDFDLGLAEIPGLGQDGDDGLSEPE